MSTVRRQMVPPEFEDSKSPDYKYVYASGVFGGLSPNDGRIIFFLDRLEPETVKEPVGSQRVKKIIRELQVEVHLTPSQFKSTAMWMTDHVKKFEEIFGPIPMAPKKGTKPPEGVIV
jgi:hypothetical protein